MGLIPFCLSEKEYLVYKQAIQKMNKLESKSLDLEISSKSSTLYQISKNRALKLDKINKRTPSMKNVDKFGSKLSTNFKF